MVQYAEIKELETIIKNFENDMRCKTVEDIYNALYHLKKYHTILEGWYGDEQYHIEKDLGL